MLFHISYLKLTKCVHCHTWAQFHNQGFTLSVNPNNCWPNFEWFTVLFKQIQLSIVKLLSKILTICSVTNHVCSWNNNNILQHWSLCHILEFQCFKSTLFQQYECSGFLFFQQYECPRFFILSNVLSLSIKVTNVQCLKHNSIYYWYQIVLKACFSYSYTRDYFLFLELRDVRGKGGVSLNHQTGCQGEALYGTSARHCKTNTCKLYALCFTEQFLAIYVSRIISLST